MIVFIIIFLVLLAIYFIFDFIYKKLSDGVDNAFEAFSARKRNQKLQQQGTQNLADRYAGTNNAQQPQQQYQQPQQPNDPQNPFQS